ncbi:MAG: acyl-homoserine-lactone synthase [Nitrospirota bacterium]|nr:acyl-homoserine-lactone synthase [Nitrospirota bacterium]
MVPVKSNSWNNTRDPVDSFILICEGDIIVKNLEYEREKIQAHHLRYRIFCQELRWVSESEVLLEIDEYDNHAVFFGVLDRENRLLAYLRLIMSEKPFMLEKEFLSLVGPEHKIRKESNRAEISRLCVAPEARNAKVTGNYGTYGISMFLFKGIYHWCIKNGIRYLYAVTEEKVFRLFCTKGFPYRLIGSPTTMPDGVTAMAVIMDWREFEILSSVKRPEMMRWFTQYQSTVAQLQWQQRASWSQHRVFA